MSHKITDKWQKYLRENKKVEEKFSPDDFKDVYNTARMAHVGQTRRDGSEYFSHPSEVRNITAKFYPKDRVAQLAALLHDSLEDAPGSTVSSEEEMEEFIRGSIQDPAAGDEVIRVVRALTHEKGGDYLSYVVDLMGDEPTLRVKLSDMVHNLTDNPSPKQKAKYKSALDAIAAKTGGSAPKGISDKHWDTLMDLASGEVNEVLSKDTYDAINKKVDEFGYNTEGLYELVLKIFNQMGDSEVSSILGKLREGITKEQLATFVAEKVLDKFDGDYQRSIVKPKKLKEEEMEGSMHRTSLAILIQDAQDLLAMIRDSDNLPEWLESKITKAKDYIAGSKNYMAGQVARAQGALEEKAVSKAQQRFMGMVKNCKETGDCSSSEVERAADSMTGKEVDDFASTKHKGLPDKKEELRKRIREVIVDRLSEEPAKGKKYSKTVTNPKTGRKKKVSYGAKGYRIAPGTSKGDSYCARSYGIKKGLSKDKQNDPNTPNNLSRKKWKCRGKKSMKENN